ncbi:hypothetical protein IIC38_19835 [candidate division KSB1 bacterium]|nr:hypothetical protein [candidate division KSB1 bacterium]
MKKGAIIFLLFTTYYNCSLAQIEIMEKFDLGEFSVGFKYETLTDYSRTYGDGYRSIQLFIWYPAGEKSITPLQYGEYFLLNDLKSQAFELDTANKKTRIDSLLRQEIKRLNKLKKNDVKLSKYKNLKTIAQRGVPVSQKSFPLLLFAPGGNTSYN